MVLENLVLGTGKGLLDSLVAKILEPYMLAIPTCF